MDLRYINPFVASAVTVIKEAVGVTAKKKQIYIAKGKESLGGVSIFLNIVGDVEGQIIFDLPPGISTVIAKEMVGLNLKEVIEDQEHKDLFKSAITELGNMISGMAITKLEEHKYDCDITPPKVYVGPKTKLTHPSMSTIVIEMVTNVGDFSINLVNKKDHYLDNIRILSVACPDELMQEFAHDFIPRGFYIYSCNDLETSGKYYLKKEKIDFVFIDADLFSENLENTLEDIRNTSINEKTKIILLSNKKDPVFLKRIQQLAVSGYILKELSPPQIIAKFQAILARLGVKVSERRKQITSEVTPEDKFKINIQLDELTNKISGDINELGVGGLLFTPENEEDVHRFDEHMDLKGVSVNLKGRFVLLDAVVTGIKEGQIALRYTSVKEKFLHLLTEIVFDKTQLI